MLMVAPMGKINLQTRGSTLFLFSNRPMVTGRVALLEAVPVRGLEGLVQCWLFLTMIILPNAVVNALVMLPMNLKGRDLVTRV